MMREYVEVEGMKISDYYWLEKVFDTCVLKGKWYEDVTFKSVIVVEGSYGLVDKVDVWWKRII